MVFKMIASTLLDLMQMLHTKKQDDSLDATEKRHISVVYTEIEKIVAYVQTYLVKESES